MKKGAYHTKPTAEEGFEALPLEQAFDEQSPENYEELMDAKNFTELKEPEDIEETDPEMTQSAANHESEGTTRTSSPNPIPQSKHTFWLQKTVQYMRIEESYINILSLAFYNHSSFLQIVPLISGAWNIIEHGYQDRPEYEEMEERVSQLYNHASVVSLWLNEGNTVLSRPLARRYYPMLNDAIETWAKINRCANNLGLGIGYKKSDRAMEILRRFKADPSKAIAKAQPKLELKETKKPEEDEEAG